MVDKLFTKIASLKTNCSKKSVKDTLKGFGDFKNKQQKCMKWCFLMCKSMCILKLYSIHYTLRWNKNLRKISFGQNKQYKKCFFFFRKLQLITVLLLICDSYMSWSTEFVSLKLCAGFSIIGSIPLLFFYIFSCLDFCATKCMNSFWL